jgi:PadR family transcriptional regulator PadR
MSIEVTTKEPIAKPDPSLVLSILKEGDSYGYELMQKVKERTKGEINFYDVSIYLVLKPLCNDRMIKGYWAVKNIQRPRRYYTILKKGIQHLERINL